MATPSSSACKALQLEFKSIELEPVEGFRVKLNEDSLFEWQVAIFGPPSTLYEGGYFKVGVNVTLYVHLSPVIAPLCHWFSPERSFLARP